MIHLRRLQAQETYPLEDDRDTALIDFLIECYKPIDLKVAECFPRIWALQPKQ